MRRRRKAIEAFERALLSDDREMVALKELARLYSQEGREDRTAECFATIVEISPPALVLSSFVNVCEEESLDWEGE